MASSYYKPCKELDRCLELDQYWEKDMKKWFEGYLVIAEETSYALAECQVGYAYLEGIGVEKNVEKALYWTTRSAEHGDRDGQCNLAWIYEEGLSGKNDLELAKYWYKLSALQDHDLSLEKCKEYKIVLEEFRKPNINDLDEINDYKQEFIEENSEMDGTGILIKTDAKEWLLWNDKMEIVEDANFVRSLQFGLFDKITNRLLGMLQIRLELRGYLIEFGGHIGYCVRPTERKKGYATKMLKLALEECKKHGLTKVLVTCLETNIASAKTIEACGGIFEKVVYDNQNYKANMKRYWISLNN